MESRQNELQNEVDRLKAKLFTYDELEIKKTYLQLGDLYKDHNKNVEALNAYSSSIRYTARIYSTDNDRAEYQRLSFKAYSRLGDVYQSQREYDEAIAYYLQALELDKESALIHLKLGVTYKKKSDNQTAVQYFILAIEKDERCAEAYQALGFISYLNGKYDVAISYYTAAIKSGYPSQENCYYQLGAAQQRNKNYSAAVDAYSKAIIIKNDFALAYFSRGNAYRAEEKWGDAFNDYYKAIELAKAQMDNDLLKDVFKDSCDQLEILLSNEKVLRDISKQTLFNIILFFPVEKQIPLLKSALEKDTVLGKRFWKKEGLRECSLEHGMLKKINERLAKLGKQEKMGLIGRISSIWKPTFIPAPSQDKRFDDENNFKL